MASAIGANANLLGCALGFLWPSLFVRPTYDDTVSHT
eukprot:CAMPEP_0116880166 /NCGR_PEP_ID=MMETSP0463-20121206/12064_1 /TAXON_ID=181622 /ORGANISM="Strombidinopsis sp, Strain SopsisLIS2011" /LENGTH=36 /DNA_ID= /DNA_START= /DNA_END= /DNA_ORIENTATION=